MNYLTQIGCCLFMLIATAEASQDYIINPMYARTFGLLNLLVPSKVTRSEFTALTNRVSSLERTYGTLRIDVDDLRSDFSRLQSQVNAIPRARCPPNSDGARMLPGYSFCYRPYSTPAINSDARGACGQRGGTLAEPLFSQSAAFYTALRTAFPDVINSIGSTGKIWIGLARDPNEEVFHYLTYDVYFNFTNVFDPSNEALTVTGNNTYVLFVSPGTSTWSSVEVVIGTPGPAYPYICQFNVIY